MSAIYLVAQGLLLAVLVGSIIFVRLLVLQVQTALADVRAERELTRRVIGWPTDQNVPPVNMTTIGAGLDRLQGFAPTAPWQVKVPPVDESIQPGAKLPTLEPGDTDSFEIEPEAESKIVSPIPPDEKGR